MKPTQNIQPTGSTLVEIMLVVAILGFLPAIAIANFVKPRSLLVSRRYSRPFRRSHPSGGESCPTPDLASRMFLAWSAFVQPVAVQWWRMQLRSLLPFRQARRVIRRFGQARLFRLPNGQHELIGGTAADRAAALEWASVFAHGIVFTHSPVEAPTFSRSPQSLFASHRQPALGTTC